MYIFKSKIHFYVIVLKLHKEQLFQLILSYEKKTYSIVKKGNE